MATKLKNLRISKVDFVDEGANPDAHIKLTKSKGEKGQSTGENGDKNGFVSRLFGFIGKKAGMNQEEIDSAVEEVLKGNSVSFNERFNEIKNRKIADEIWDIVCDCQESSVISVFENRKNSCKSANALDTISQHTTTPQDTQRENNYDCCHSQMSAANILLLAYVSLLPFGKYYSATYSKARIYHK